LKEIAFIRLNFSANPSADPEAQHSPPISTIYGNELPPEYATVIEIEEKQKNEKPPTYDEAINRRS